MAITFNPNVPVQTNTPAPQNNAPSPDVKQKTLGEQTATAAQPAGVAKAQQKGINNVVKNDAVEGAHVLTAAPNMPVIADAPPVGVQTLDAELAASLQGFSALATQLGAPRPGSIVAAQFAATALVPEQAGPLPLVVYGREVGAAVGTLMKLVNNGTLKLSANLQHRLETRFELINRPALPATLPVTLNAAQQAAVTQMVSATRTLMNGFKFPAPGERRPSASYDLSRREDGDLRGLPPHLAELMRNGFAGILPVTEREGQQSQQQAPAQGVGRAAAQQTAAPAEGAQRSTAVETSAFETEGAQASLEEITIPGPEVIAFEEAVQGGLGSFEGMDVEMMAMVVMFEVQRSATDDLKETLGRMKELNAVKKQQREFIANLKKERANAEKAMREEYDRRCAIPPPDVLHIDSSVTKFSDFTAAQSMQNTVGGATEWENGVPPGTTPRFGISPNPVLFDYQLYDENGRAMTRRDLEMAGRLNVRNADITSMREIWATDATARAQFSTFEEWLTARAPEGCGLQVPSIGSQSQRIAEIIRDRDPENVMRAIGTQFNVAAAEIRELFDHFNTKLTPEQQRQGFAGWLTSQGLDPVDTDGNQAKAEALLSSLTPVEASDGAGPVAGVETAAVDATAERFGLSPEALAPLARLLAEFPSVFLPEQPASLDALLMLEPPAGPGLVPGEDNVAKLQEWSEAMRGQVETGSISMRVGGRNMDSNALIQEIFDMGTGPATSRDATIGTAAKALWDSAAAAFPQAAEKLRGMLDSILLTYDIGTKWSVDIIGEFMGALMQGPVEMQRYLQEKGISLSDSERAAFDDPAAFAQLKAACGVLVASVIRDARHGGQNGAVVTGQTLVSELGLITDGNHSHNNDFDDAFDYDWIDQGEWQLLDRELTAAMENVGFPPVAGLTGAARMAAADLFDDCYDRARIDQLPAPAELSDWPEDFPLTTTLEGLGGPLSDEEKVKLAEMMDRWDGSEDGLSGMMGEAPARMGLSIDPSFRSLLARYFRDNGSDAFKAHFAPAPPAGAPRVVPGFTLDPSIRREAIRPAGVSDRVLDQIASGALINIAPQLTPPPPAGMDPAAALAALNAPSEQTAPERFEVAEMSMAQLDAYIESCESQKESTADLTEEISLKLQMQQDRLSKAYTTLSNLLKKWSDTTGAIVSNLK